MASAQYDVTSDGGSDVTSDVTSKRHPWAGTQKPDDEFVQARLTAGNLRRFDAWFESQIPDARQRPGADPYRDRIFAYGLDAFIKAFPPVQTLKERLAELDRQAS